MLLETLLVVFATSRVFVVKIEVPLGFLYEEGNDAHASIPGASVAYVAKRKKRKHDKSWLDHGYGFLPFTFSTLGELGVGDLELLKRIKQVGAAHFNNPKIASFIY
ncbi:hypothetical protein OROHE_017857 [Orobanche hederae]